ncbi:MAG: thiamine phosphate synthase [Pirellulaceae bacterium]
MSADDSTRPAADAGAIYRILDANCNRSLEGLRVVEDGVRFMWEDQHLVHVCKQLRHDLVAALAPLSRRALHASRDTLGDVGTEVTTAGEYRRENLQAVVAANWSRTQQALRTLEEYAKVVAPEISARLESLRYRAYTIERAVTMLDASLDRLASAQLYVLIDGCSAPSVLRALLERLLEAGVDIVQLRDKSLTDRALLERARLMREVTRQHHALFIINDRVDLAAMVQADGVHVGQEEVPVREARSVLGSNALIGVSTHTIAQARQAVLEGASYLGCGPTFPSATKSFPQFAGLDFLREVSQEIRLPAFAIGGIGPTNVQQVCAAGFSRVAVSHSVVHAADPRQAVQQLRSCLPGVERPAS